jgi:hypothetical protein
LQPIGTSLFQIIKGILTVLAIFFIYGLIAPEYFFKNIDKSLIDNILFFLNNADMHRLWFFLIFSSLLFFTGITTFLKGLKGLLGGGDYFIGTPTRLVIYKKGEIRSID